MFAKVETVVPENRGTEIRSLEGTETWKRNTKFGPEFVAQPSHWDDSTSRNKKKILYTFFFLSGTRFSRKSTLKFVRLCERFSCLFFYRGCLR